MIRLLKLEEKKQHYLVTAFYAFIVAGLVEWIWPNVIPFTFFQFWKITGPIPEAIKLAWPIFAWGTGISFLIVLFKGSETYGSAEDVLSEGLVSSVFAGIFEEISFRWLIFFDAIVSYKLVNWLFFGFAGHGIPEWLYNHIGGPWANFLTMGHMQEILFGTLGWAVGAALLSTNGKFRDGHMYQGCLGWINSWFLGIFFFYIVFNYGLIPAILIHGLYDIFIDLAVFIAMKIRGE